ncbi:unnamed protein product, partial [Iphiclides podalirius]
MTAFHLPGNLNGIADYLSRGRPVLECHLLPPATEAIFRRWGTPEVDLYATKETAVVTKYVTLDLDWRWLGAFLRRLQSRMEIPNSMGIPISEYDTQGLNNAVGTY